MLQGTGSAVVTKSGDALTVRGIVDGGHSRARVMRKPHRESILPDHHFW